MILSFSGIGGSGKTTQIASLSAALRERGVHVELIALRDEFLWPRLVGAVKRGGGSGSGSGSAKRRAGTVKHVLRGIFYVLDFWRIYVVRIAPASRRGTVIVDRYWYDFIVELALDRGQLGVLAQLLRLAPKPQVAFWFAIAPEVALARKYEVPLGELERHARVYDEVFARVPHLAVDAAAPPDAVQSLLRFVSFAAWPARAFCSKAVLLFADQDVLRALGKSSWKPFLRNAGRNRAQYLALQKLLGAPGSLAAFSDAHATAEDRAEKREKAVDILARYGGEVAVTKQEHGIELGSDVDVVFRTREAMLEFTTWSEAQGARVENVDADKCDVFFGGALPIDVHVGMTFSGFPYLAAPDFFEHPREAEALTVIAHAANELTVIAAGDLLKIEALGDLDAAVMERIARAHGWLALLRYWQRNSDPAALGYRLPHAIPAWRLLLFRLRRWAHRPDGNVLADAVMLAKGVRARLLGHIPYHEPWYRV